MIRLAVLVERSSAELVLAELLELAPGGVEEVEHGTHVEYALYGAPGELPSLPDLKAAAGAGGALVEIHTTEVADDWSERWRGFHRPVVVAPPQPSPGRPGPPAIRVRPPWEPSEASGSELQEIVIDPGQAFGTGAHATTRLCLQLLLELSAEDPPGGSLVDVGCGSGVLAIVASKLGYAPVVALDNDPLSVQATEENATANGVELDVRRADLRAAPTLLAGAGPGEGGDPPPVVVANLLRGLLLELAGALTVPPRALIASGLLTGESGEVAEAFGTRMGMRVRGRAQCSGWEGLLLEGPAPS
ncbi:MAG TPA: 50S ribosomal protein L11 methyltransferase [Solirubrobacteraceae bacterium]|nr:50S ribosomal protein L11 methyltransferase [Solirubrobacteraceae bacterium]